MTRKINWAVFVLSIVVVVLTTRTFAADPPLQIVITSPRDGASVPWRPCFQGTVSDPHAQVWLIIHDKSGDYYVEPGPISTKDNGKWSTRPYIAEDKPGVFEGIPFEAKAFANPKAALAEGQTLSGWPEAEAASPLIDITRQDNAPSGCDESDAEPLPGKAAQSVPEQSSPPCTATLIDRQQPPRHILSDLWKAVRIWVLFFASVLFCTMAALPHRARAAVEWLERWCVAFGRGFWSFIPQVWRWLIEYSRSIWGWGHKQISRNWVARGYAGNYKQVALHLVLLPLLICLILPGLYTEAKSIRAGLAQTFPASSEPSGHANHSGLLLPLTTPIEQSEVRAPAVVGGETPNRDSTLARVRQVLSAIQDVLSRDEFLFMALGLAALQAALGAILLLGMEESDALRISLPALFRARPIVASFFLGMDIALTLLAANRGFESSPETINWAMPTLVAALIASVMPWVLGYILHFAMESFADCFGPLQSLFACLALFLGSAIAQVGWGIAVILILALRFGALVAFGVLSVLALAFLRFAAVVGEFLRWLSNRVGGWFPPQTPGDELARPELT